MTFSRAWPSGVTDDVTIVTAAALNQLDVDHARAVDGSAGGTYGNVAEIRFTGDFAVEGTVTLDGDTANIAYRAEDLTNANHTLHGEADYYFIPVATSNKNLTLATTTAPVPPIGTVITIRTVSPTPANAFVAYVLSEGNATPIVSLTNDSAGEDGSSWVKCIRRAGGWRAVEWGGDILFDATGLIP